jgi:predicted site-specific integrase-resolvase
MANDLISELNQERKSYLSQIEQASREASTGVLASLNDRYAQFLCEAIKKLLKKARDTDELAKQNPGSREIIQDIATAFRNHSSFYSKLYRDFEKAQREKRVVTNIPQFDYSELIKLRGDKNG